MWFGVESVVATLAVDLADRVDRREVHSVKAHPCHTVQFFGGGGEGAVHRVAVLVPAARGAGEEFVPGAHQGFTALYINLVTFAARE